ncbi:MAG: small multi-drug export protein [Clostridia bacterium]|nr:small multi-drug export protein [Clostridia bacterium]
MIYFIETALIAMVPVLELRGAIPFGIANGIDPVICYLIAVAANMIPVPFIILFLRRLIWWLKEKGGIFEKPALWIEKRAEKKKGKVLRYEFWGLVLIVAIPLPGTGAWTGALVASMMDMQLKRAVPAVLLGVIIAGVLVTLATLGIISVI